MHIHMCIFECILYTQTTTSTKIMHLLGSQNSDSFHLGLGERSFSLDILLLVNNIPFIKKKKKALKFKGYYKKCQHFHYPFVSNGTSSQPRHFSAAIKSKCLLRQNSMNALWLIKNVLDDSSEKGSEA